MWHVYPPVTGLHAKEGDKMKKCFTKAIAAALVSAFVLAGCGQSAPATSATDTQTTTDVTEPAAQPAEDKEAEPAEPAKAEKPSKDRSGNDIVVPEEIGTIVSMAPSVTRVLIDMGLADKIVAADTNSQASYGTELKDDVLYMNMMTPDQEQLVALKPDIVFTSGMSSKDGTDVFAAVRTANICVAEIPSSSSIEAIKEDLRFIGACVDKNEEAEGFVADMEKAINGISEIAKTIPEEEKKTVLFELFTPSADYPTIYSAGPGTYINEMLEIVGAKNIAGDSDSQWPALEEEFCVGADPQVILTADMYTPDVINVLLGMSGWENVTAIKDRAVYQLDSDQVNQPNHHIIYALIDMAEAIYPEYFADAEQYRPAA